MKRKLCILAIITAALAGCASDPSADNYNDYMNSPQVKQGAAGNIDSQVANQAAWNEIKVTQMTTTRTMPDGSYAPDANSGVLTVRAVLVNTGDTPTQGNWRCLFFDSNNMPLYEDDSNAVASDDTSLGWHKMVVYPLSSKSQTVNANVVRCKATDSLATNYRVEFHDTSNDITVYNK